MSKKQKQIPYAQLPKPLINTPISNDAKLLYTLLNDRFQLSLKTISRTRTAASFAISPIKKSAKDCAAPTAKRPSCCRSWRTPD